MPLKSRKTHENHETPDVLAGIDQEWFEAMKSADFRADIEALFGEAKTAYQAYRSHRRGEYTPGGRITSPADWMAFRKRNRDYLRDRLGF